MIATFGPYTVSIGKSLTRSEWLVGASYWKQGYAANHTLDDASVVIDAELYGSVVGTILVKLDSANGLYADASYAPALDELRLSGRKLAELSRFVILPGQPTSSVMGAMFHAFYYYTSLLHGVTDMIGEVVPRHVAAHKRLIGLTQIAGPGPCKRIGGESTVLLHRELS